MEFVVLLQVVVEEAEVCESYSVVQGREDGTELEVDVDSTEAEGVSQVDDEQADEQQTFQEESYELSYGAEETEVDCTVLTCI